MTACIPLTGSESINAREGIKTNKHDDFVPGLFSSESINAREGIKTHVSCRR